MNHADRDGLLAQARQLRERKRIPDALAILAHLQDHDPTFSRLYQERGQCHIAQGQAGAAIVALREAVRLNPTLPASWDMLAQLCRMLGDHPQAEAAARNLAMLQNLPPELVMANCLFTDGDLVPAEAVIRAYLHKDGGNVGAQRLLARIRNAIGAPAEAEALLATALTQAPDYHEARADYAMVLLQQQKFVCARREAEHLLAHDPGNQAAHKTRAAACIGMGDYAPVVDIYAHILADLPASGNEVAQLRQWRAEALKVLGRVDEAIADYRAALVAQRDYGVAWFGLANLKTYRFSDDDVAQMCAAVAQTALADVDRIYLHFALGKALEDRADYAASWQWYRAGNALRNSFSRYRPDVAQACVQRLRQTFTAQAFKDRAGWGLDDPAPIFVVGLPRSGSTLIEQILASHSDVEGTQELTEIGRYAADLCGSDPDCGLPVDPAALLAMTAADAQARGRQFCTQTRAYRPLGRPRFIDKMPNNFWHIGLIHLILPQAVVIDVRREPMACGFSNLKQLFGTNTQEFSYDIDHVARHYGAYLDLMRHWDTVLPGRVLRVHYEDVVDDLESSVRRILAHCGLAFEPACLEFHQNRRSVRTPSSEQVRQPIGRDGLARWQCYEPWLAPLRDALGPALTTYRN